MAVVLLDKRPSFDIQTYLGDTLDSWQDLNPANGYVSVSGGNAVNYRDRITNETWTTAGASNRPAYDTVSPANLAYSLGGSDYMQMDSVGADFTKFYGPEITWVKAISLADTQTNGTSYLGGNNNVATSIGSCLLLDNTAASSRDQRIVWQVGDGSSPFTIDTTATQTPDRVWTGDEKFILSVQHGSTEAVLRVNHIIYRRVALSSPNFSSSNTPARVTTRGTISSGYAGIKEYGDLLSTVKVNEQQLIDMTMYLAGVAGVTKALNSDATPVYFLKGQSNAKGQDSASNSILWPLNKTVPDVIVNRSPCDLSHLVSGRTESADNLFDTGNYSLNVNFGAAMATYHGKEVIVIKGAFGSTGLNADWWPNNGPGTTLINSLNIDKEVLNRLDRIGRNWYLAGMLWVQGETDAATQAAADRYYQNFTEMAAYIRLFHNAPELPIITTEIDWTGSYLDTVNQALEDFGTNDPYSAFVTTKPWSVIGGGNNHMSAPCTDTIAASQATAMQGLVTA